MSTLSPTNARYTASSARIATNENYISTIDLHKPDRSEDFIKRYGTQNLTGLLEMAGAKAPATQSTFSHYEEEYIHNTITVNADATEASGVFDIKIDAEVDVDGSGSASKRSSVRLNDIIMFPDGKLGFVCGLRTHTDGADATGSFIAPATAAPAAPGATNVETISVTSYDGSTPGAIVDGDVLAIVGNEHAEGTDQPVGLTPKATLYSNNVMIMKESFEVTGSEATNVVYVKVQNADGSEGYLWYLKGENDTYRRFQNYCEMMMLLGEKASDGTLDDNFRGTQGLLPEIKANGSTLATSNAFAAADIDEMVKALDRERGAKNNAFYCGIDLSLEVDDAIADFNAGQVSATNEGRSFSYGEFQMGSAVDMGFTSFTRGGYTFNKSVYDPFNYTGMLGGAAGTQDAAADYRKIGFTMPLDNRRDAAGDAVPSMRIRYKEANGYSREMEHWFTGGAVLQDKTNSVDNLKCHYRTERGLEVFGANRFMLVTR